MYIDRQRGGERDVPLVALYLNFASLPVKVSRLRLIELAFSSVLISKLYFPLPHSFPLLLLLGDDTFVAFPPFLPLSVQQTSLHPSDSKFKNGFFCCCFCSFEMSGGLQPPASDHGNRTKRREIPFSSSFCSKKFFLDILQ